jgi:DNA polymerase III subunit gamma/tau
MQLVHLKNIDVKKEIFNNDNFTNNENLKQSLVGENIKEENVETNLSTQVKNQLKNIDQIKSNPVKNLSPHVGKAKIEITRFQDLIDQANKEKEIELKFDLERNVKLVSFNKGKINISFNEKLNQNFIKNLTEKLLLWTGDRWIISLSKNNDAKSIYEQSMEQKSSKLTEFKKSELAKQIEKAFPDAKLVDIQEDNND